MHQYSLEGQIRTDFTGFRQLLKLYHALRDVYNQEIFLDFKDLDWFDANMAAVLCGIQHKLNSENNLSFVVNHQDIRGRFDVLHRNGCFQPNEERIEDVQQSTIACTHFYTDQCERFKHYVETDLFAHRGLAELRKTNQNIVTRIKGDLLEIFNNYRVHAQTPAPFFVCGQYFPQYRRVVFTMTDLGVGFLPPIQTFSHDTVKTSHDAIHWALIGGSTQASDSETSGCGLSSILDFCKRKGGDLQIVTGDSFWSTDLLQTPHKGYKTFQSPFVGTTVSITFNGLGKV